MIDELDNSDSITAQTAVRKLRLFTVGSRHFGIFEDEIATVSAWREPAPLPHAPASVIGLVGIQGRMLTVLDLARIAGRDAGAAKPHDDNRQILALRGDEQLALVVDVLGETIEIQDPASANKSETSGLVVALIHHGETEVSILNVKELFPSAIQGRERRRRRF